MNDNLNDNSKKYEYTMISGFFLKHTKFTYVLMFGILLLGLMAIITIPKESEPEVKIPIAVVNAIYPGASAEDVERLVTDKIEDKILGLSGLDIVNSTSREAVSSVVVEFGADEDLDDSIRKLRDKVDDAKSDLPDEVNNVKVVEISMSNKPVMYLTLSGPYSIHQLKQYGEELADNIKKISKVSEVVVVGGQDREINILVDKKKLDLYKISLSQVVSAISLADANLPVGAIQTDNFKYNIRFKADITEPEEIERLPITNLGNSLILVKDIATVINGYEEKKSISELSINGEKAQTSVSLQVSKETGGNIINMSKEIREVGANLTKEFPEGVEIDYTIDMATYIKRDLLNLSKNGLTTVLIVFIILLLFLGWKEAIVASLGIPLTFLFTFFAISSIGYTLNFMTLFGLILSLGILVDTTIVMTEGIHQNVKKGIPVIQAALRTLVEYRLPLISGTLTTVSAFVPLLFMSGIMGEYIRSIPITVSIVLLSSLAVALFIIPTVAALVFKQSDKNKDYAIGGLHPKADLRKNKRIFSLEKYINKLNLWYQQTLKVVLDSRKYQRIFMITIFVLLLGSISLIPLGILKIAMFEEVDQETFTIDVTMPIGTPLQETMRMAEKVKTVLYTKDVIKSFTLSVGGSETSSSHNASFVVTLPDSKTREEEITSLELITELREELKSNIEKENIRVSQEGAGPPSASPVAVNFKGPDLAILESLANDMKQFLATVPGTAEVDTSVDEVGTEFVFKLDKEKASRYGLSAMQIAQELRTAVYGTTATTIKYEGNDIDVNVVLNLNNQSKKIEDNKIVSIEEIKSFLIPTRSGNLPLSSLVDISLASSQSSIKHEDGDRIISATGQLQTGAQTADIFASAKEYLNTMNIPQGYEVTVGGEDEDIQESFADLFKALFIGLLLIAAILILQFNSFRQPMFILLTLPFAFIGVFPGLAALNLAVSFPAFFGIVALAGIVVNNAIILIDKINSNRREGLVKKQAILDAAPSRLQPIILTTITTIAGILPLALSEPIWGGLGFSLIFGLLASTILTLYMIPIVYLRLGEKELK